LPAPLLHSRIEKSVTWPFAGSMNGAAQLSAAIEPEAHDGCSTTTSRRPPSTPTVVPVAILRVRRLRRSRARQRRDRERAHEGR
jgi:hypothetical protein